jgi:hypothetical protein
MPQNAQETADLATVRSDGQPGVGVVCKEVVQDAFRAGVLSGRRLGKDPGPERVVFGELGLEGEGWEEGFDGSFVAAAVAGVGGDSFAEELFDGGVEGVLFGKGEVGEG